MEHQKLCNLIYFLYPNNSESEEIHLNTKFKQHKYDIKNLRIYLKIKAEAAQDKIAS